jgi:hypothetical protein
MNGRASAFKAVKIRKFNSKNINYTWRSAREKPCRFTEARSINILFFEKTQENCQHEWFPFLCFSSSVMCLTIIFDMTFLLQVATHLVYHFYAMRTGIGFQINQLTIR